MRTEKARPAESNAESLDAPGLLRAAARLVNRALLQLETSSAPCVHCRATLFADRDQMKVYEQFCELPDKLVRAAERIEELGQPGKGLGPSHGYTAAHQAVIDGR